MTALILASQSAARRAMLEAAGVPHEAEPARVDEDAVKASFRAQGRGARDLADALAELKAVKMSGRVPGAFVLGCDSTVALADGTMLDKPESREDAAAQLRAMRGSVVRLWSAAVLAERGVPTWRVVDGAKLHVRAFSDVWLETYLDAEWPAIAGCVGAFRLEGPGVQLFSRVEGDHFTILGLPLLPLLDHLRVRGVLPA
ncbi:Maf family protein [Sphingomonas jatrophae]|uniref:Nucleoside triphosphate pyrophosphatase n=1 Tax=Sphingomonas jatrophae TaxID=1166337 RepID=A0A1I6LNT0_9SPHN|nr:nucleoside triphosphate pyrophosphatase [Sphingomonas jatrophae]SFS05115.1 septum formation protein [Sphingomonas jatrophae]